MTHWRLFYHFVWSTKNRETIIDAQREAWIQDSIQSTCSRFSVLRYEVGIMPDHVHLFVSLPPQHSVSAFMQRIKGGSTHYINEREESRTFKWQREYGAYSIHEHQIPRLIEYIQNQDEHHATNQIHPNLETTEREFKRPGPIPTNR